MGSIRFRVFLEIRVGGVDRGVWGVVRASLVGEMKLFGLGVWV